MKLVVKGGTLVDLDYGAKGLVAEDTLYSAVLISLLTDRRAKTDDIIPDDTGAASPIPPNRRGWAGDALAETPGDRIGSRLWLLRREKVTEETRQRALTYTRECLEWLIEDGLAKSVTVEAEWAKSFGVTDRLNISVGIYTISGGYEQYSTDVAIGV